MTDFPLLPMPAPAHRERKGRGFGGDAIRLPDRRRQGERLGPVFQRLRDAMDPDHPHTFGEDPAGIAPERALVFEIAGSVTGFRRAVAKVDGFEFLGDEDTESAADEDFAVIDQRKGRKGQDRDNKLVSGRMYLAMPDLQALEQLLSLWRRHQAGESAAPGFTPWWHVFDRLRVLRAWGPEDRVPEDTIEWIRQMLADKPDAAQRIEVELLNCATPAKREAARRSFDAVLREAGGRLIDSASIPEVAYEAALIDLPSHALRNLIARRDVIALSDAVMAVRPQSMVSFPIASVETEAGSSQAPRAEIRGQPVAAVFDGVPVQRHALLDGRLRIDDPDELELRSDVALRHHGTAMASLVVHGDRNREELPLTRQVYFRPVLIPNDDGSWEEFPGDRLLIDTIYRAVKRMKEGDAEGEATAPTVFLVNLSLGDPRRPFAGPISPWARLLDHLAARYGVLFLVSAGNVTGSLPVPAYRSMTEIETATPSKQRQAVLDGAWPGVLATNPALASGSSQCADRRSMARRRFYDGTPRPPCRTTGERGWPKHHIGHGARLSQGRQAGHHDAGRPGVGEDDDTGRGTCLGGHRSRTILRTKGGGARGGRRPHAGRLNGWNERSCSAGYAIGTPPV